MIHIFIFVSLLPIMLLIQKMFRSCAKRQREFEAAIAELEDLRRRQDRWDHVRISAGAASDNVDRMMEDLRVALDGWGSRTGKVDWKKEGF